jgi:hypothetical protein
MKDLSIFVMSWNCNACNPFSINSLNKEKLFNFNRGKVDLVLINLQEMVELNTSNVMGNNEAVLIDWQKVIEESLN